MSDLPRPQLIVVAHNLRSMANVGSIFRTCDGAGFDRVIISGYTGAPPDQRIAKVALGAEESVPFDHVQTDDELLALLEGMFVVVIEQHPNSVLSEELVIPLDATHVAVVLSDELFGAPSVVVDRADAFVELPMRGMKESLNVAIAFGIAGYAIADQVYADGKESLRSRHAPRPVREGVLTNGPTVGETPLNPRY